MIPKNAKRFSLNTHSRVSSIYKRLWFIYLYSQLIVQDINKLIFNMKLIIDNKGYIFPSLSNSSCQYI